MGMYKKIIISLHILIMCYGSINAQDLLNGRLLSAIDSVPIAGATILLEPGNRMVTSDETGGFSLKLPKGKYRVSVKHIGFEERNLTIQIPADEMILFLQPIVNTLNEVSVNTGYQVLPKERATGSFVTLDNKVLSQQFSTDIISRLEAVANSVTVDRRSSASGNLMVRGLSTLSGPRDPLIILDNFPYQGNLNNINPNDIESITILKDAAAASIWGSRAGNGVIVLTSKKAKAGQPLTIDVNTNFTLGKKPDLFSIQQMSTPDFIEVEQMLYAKGFYNSRISGTAKAALSPVIELLLANTRGLLNNQSLNEQLEILRNMNTKKELLDINYRNPINRQFALSLRGSEKLIDWSIGAGYDRNNSDLDAVGSRLNINSRNTIRFTKNLQFDANLNYTRYQNGQGKASYQDMANGSGVIYPYLRLVDENGNAVALAKTYSLSYLSGLNRNVVRDWNYYPLTDYLNNDVSNLTNDVVANATLTYKLTNGLKASVNYQYERQNQVQRNIYGIDSYTVRALVNTFTQVSSTGEIINKVPKGGILDLTESTLEAQNLRGQLNYEKTWGDHDLSLLSGAELSETNNDGYGSRTYGYNNDNLAFTYADLTTTYPNYITGSKVFIDPGPTGFSGRLNRFVSIYGNGSYTYLGKYTVSGSARKDASNLYGLRTNEKWKPLWSIGLAWKISSEDFFNTDFLSYLKLRGTYGFSGNVDQGRSAVTAIMNTQVSPYTGLIMSRFSNYSNPELRWEMVGITNIGLDFAMLRNRIRGSIEVYSKNAKDLYGASPVDFTAVPTSSLVRNVANIRAKGLDLSIESQNTKGIVQWSTDLNFNLYRDKVVDYYLTNTQGSTFAGNGNLVSGAAEYPVYAVFSYKWAGLDPKNGNPQGYLNGQVSTDYNQLTGAGTQFSDLVYHGPAFPTMFGTIGNTISFKNLSLTARVSYKLGYYFRRNSITYTDLYNSGIGHPDYNFRWQQSGDELHTSVPSLVYPAVSRRDAFYTYSDVLVEKGDHIRLAYVSIAYSLDKKLIKKLPVKSLQLQLNANNLGILWRANHYGLDPDYRDNAIIPSHSFSFGLRCSL